MSGVHNKKAKLSQEYMEITRNMFPVLTTSGLGSVEMNFDLITLLPTLQNNRDSVSNRENGSGFCISIQSIYLLTHLCLYFENHQMFFGGHFFFFSVAYSYTLCLPSEACTHIDHFG